MGFTDPEGSSPPVLATVTPAIDRLRLGPWWILLIFNVSLLLWSEIVDGGLWRPVSAHLSNFAATGLVVLVLLKLPRLRGWTLSRRLVAVGLSVTLASTLLELLYDNAPAMSTSLKPGTTFLRFYNTPDWLDAVFGIASVALIAIVLMASDRGESRSSRDSASATNTSFAS